MFGLVAESAEMWTWAYNHPYLFTMIKMSTPTLLVVLMYAASKIMFGSGVSSKRR